MILLIAGVGRVLYVEIVLVNARVKLFVSRSPGVSNPNCTQ